MKAQIKRRVLTAVIPFLLIILFGMSAEADWVTTAKGKMYTTSGSPGYLTGWQMIDGKFYYFSTYPGKVGTMMTGRIKVGNSWWPLRSDGTLDLSKKKAPNINITTSEHRHTTK